MKALVISGITFFYMLHSPISEGGTCEEWLRALDSRIIPIYTGNFGESVVKRLSRLATESWTSGVRTRHGALLFGIDGQLIGAGRTRRSTDSERAVYNPIDWSQRALIAFAQAGNRIFPKPSLDHAAHAEQAAIINARHRKKGLKGSKMFVAPVRIRGEVVEIGRRKRPFFTCQECAIWTEYFGVESIFVLTQKGWESLSVSSIYALSTENNVHGTRYWERQRAGTEVAGLENLEWMPVE